MLRACVAGAAGLLVTGLLLLLFGKEPWAAVRVTIGTVFGTRAGFVDTVLLTVPLLLIALGYGLSFRMRVWIVGGEGQFHLGAVGAAAVALGMPPTTPRAVGVPIAALAGMLAGMLWASVPGWLRAYRHVNEVVSTLMLNFIAVLVMTWLIRTSFRDPDLPLMQTPAFGPAFRLPSMGDSRLHVGLVVALVLVLGLAYVVQFSGFGHRVRVIGANPHASLVAGIDVARTMMTIFLVSGALAGLAGATQALGVTQRLLTGMSHDMGYTAVPVALLARNHPLAVPLAAFFFSALTVASEAIQVDLGIPSDFMLVFVGTLVLFTLAVEALWRRSDAP